MTDATKTVRVRAAAPGDGARIVEMIQGLAIYEKLEHLCEADGARLESHLFEANPKVGALVAEFESNGATQIVGYALYFHTYSTFLCKPGLFLEDLYVEPDFRGRGAGKALLNRLLEKAAETDCGRVEWMALDWNRPAIDFYEKVYGANVQEGWKIFGMNEDQIAGFEKRD